MGKHKRKPIPAVPILQIAANLKKLLVTTAKKCDSLTKMTTLFTPFRNEIQSFLLEIASFDQMCIKDVRQSVQKSRNIKDAERVVESYVSDCEYFMIFKASLSKTLSLFYTGTFNNASDFEIAYLFFVSENPLSYCLRNYINDLTSDKITRHSLSVSSDMCRRNFIVININKPCQIGSKVIYSTRLAYKTPPAYFCYVYNSEEIEYIPNVAVLFFKFQIPTIYSCSTSIENGRIFNQKMEGSAFTTPHFLSLVIPFDEMEGKKMEGEKMFFESVILSMQQILSAFVNHGSKEAQLTSSFKRLWNQNTNNLNDRFQPTTAMSGKDLVGKFFCTLLFKEKIDWFASILNIIFNNLTVFQFIAILAKCSSDNNILLKRFADYFSYEINLFVETMNHEFISQTYIDSSRKQNNQLTIIVWQNTLFGLSDHNLHSPSSQNLPESSQQIIERLEERTVDDMTRVIDASIYTTAYVQKVFTSIQVDLVRNDENLTQDIAFDILDKHKLLNDDHFNIILNMISMNKLLMPHGKKFNPDLDSFLNKCNLSNLFSGASVDEDDTILSLVSANVGLSRLRVPLLRLLVLYEFLTKIDFYVKKFNRIITYSTIIKLTTTDLLYHLMQYVHSTEDKFAVLPPVLFVLSSLLKRNIMLITCKNEEPLPPTLTASLVGSPNHDRDNIFILSAFGTYFLLLSKQNGNIEYPFEVERQLQIMDNGSKLSYRKDDIRKKRVRASDSVRIRSPENSVKLKCSENEFINFGMIKKTDNDEYQDNESDTHTDRKNDSNASNSLVFDISELSEITSSDQFNYVEDDEVCSSANLVNNPGSSNEHASTDPVKPNPTHQLILVNSERIPDGINIQTRKQPETSSFICYDCKERFHSSKEIKSHTKKIHLGYCYNDDMTKIMIIKL